MTKRTNPKTSRPSNRPDNSLFFAYYGTIFLFIVGWAIPDRLVWGFNWWAYQPTVLQIVLVLIALSAAPLLWLWSKRIAHPQEIDNSSTEDNNKFAILAVIISISFTALYWLLPSTTHFLGDGYSLLSRLTQEVGSMKSWDIGASLMNEAVIDMLGARSKENALMTFRILAVGSGFLMLIMVAFASSKLFDRLLDRSLFFIGMISSGYALQFFGYVENYALFVVMVIAFTLLGLLASLGKTSRWLTIIPALVACGLHIFGVALLPALMYILFFDKKPILLIEQMSQRNKVILAGAVGLFALGSYFFLFYNYYFFRFAFLPIIPDQFTVDNNYLLSPKHLGDFINLLILLVPGLLIFITVQWGVRKKHSGNGTDRRFLLILLTSTMACIYLFNPGIGMPRNWDLFSLPGIPLSILVFYILLSSNQPLRRKYLSVTMVITLGFLLLIPRVSSQRTPEIAITHFKNYVKLDRFRNSNARRILTTYYEEMGNSNAATSWHNLAVAEFPESKLTNQGKQMLKSGNFDRAESLFRQALQINPIFVDAYSNLGTCFLNRGKLEEALKTLEIADGLNPLNASIINNKGTVFLRQGNYQRAESQYLEVLRIDQNHIGAMSGLVSVSVKKQDDQQTAKYLVLLRDSSPGQVEYFKQGVAVCAEANLMRSAQLSFDMAVKLGADNAWQHRLIAKYPKLQQ